MTAHELQALEAEPIKLSSPLRALWCDAWDHWDTAHKLVQDDPSKDAAWVHAYLHRKAGEGENARYWYHLAGQPPFDGSLEDEWLHIATGLL